MSKCLLQLQGSLIQHSRCMSHSTVLLGERISLSIHGEAQMIGVKHNSPQLTTAVLLGERMSLSIHREAQMIRVKHYGPELTRVNNWW